MAAEIKQFVGRVKLGNKGIEIEARTGDGEHIGDLIVTRAGIIWCEGKTQRKNGQRLSWLPLASLARSKGSKKYYC